MTDPEAAAAAKAKDDQAWASLADHYKTYIEPLLAAAGGAPCTYLTCDGYCEGPELICSECNESHLAWEQGDEVRTMLEAKGLIGADNPPAPQASDQGDAKP